MKKKILLGQLGAHGDCLYATTIARQIKHDYPNCHLTWAIGTIYAAIVINNPYVDEIWEIPVKNHEEITTAWINFEKQAKACYKHGDFDEIFLTQIHPNNYQNFDGTIRASIFRGYPKPITVPVNPVLYLTAEEKIRVKKFAAQYNLKNLSQVILFETAAKSGQSFMTSELAMAVAKKLLKELPNIAIIFSSNTPIKGNNHNLLDGSHLTFRENAALFKYCNLLVGCSSGISWLSTVEGITPIPTIQLLKKDQSVYASMIHDFNFMGLETNHIIEMTECTEEHLVACITTFFKADFKQARASYHRKITLNFDYYFSVIDRHLQNLGQISKYFVSMFSTYERYGSHFLSYLNTTTKPMLLYSSAYVDRLKSENIMLQQTCDERLRCINKLEAELAKSRRKFLRRFKAYIRNIINRVYYVQPKAPP